MKNLVIKFNLYIVIFLMCLITMPKVIGAADLTQMIGSKIPTGTTVTVSSSTTADIGTNAIDNDLSKWWNSGKTSGTIDFNFPHAINLNAIQIATGAQPANNETYTIYGLQNGSWNQIGKATLYVTKEIIILDPIEVTSGSYDGIRISISSPTSWVVVNEISIGSNIEVPINLNASGEDKQVKLTWNPVDIAESYIIKYGTQSGTYDKTITATKDSYNNFIIPNLINGTTYYFVVSAVVNKVESDYSHEVMATPKAKVVNPTTNGNRAIMVVTMNTGLEKEFDLSMIEVEEFISWYESKQAGSGKASYAINRHDNNKGPFNNRKDYVLFDKILTFEVSEYFSEKIN